MTTKERILYETLELFSNNGYEAVSMRDIGAAVGIRESSIYKHYAGKGAILDAIVEKATKEINQMHEQLKVPNLDSMESVSQYANMKIEDVAELCTEVLLQQKRNDVVSKFRKFLTIEQYRNATLRRLYIEMFIERQLKYNEKVFAYLIQAGVLEGHSPQMMALQFHAPFFLLQYQFQDDEERLEAELKAYIVSFLREHQGRE